MDSDMTPEELKELEKLLDESYSELFNDDSSNKKFLDDLAFFSELKSFLRDFPIQKDYYYVIIGGSAYNAYIRKDLLINTPDIDLKVVSKNSGDDEDTTLKHSADFVKKLQDRLEKSYNIIGLSIKLIENFNVYQIFVNGKALLDVGVSTKKIPVAKIDGINYADIAFLLEELRIHKGAALSSGMEGKEMRRMRRENNLVDALDDITIFDEKIYRTLCNECKDTIIKSENFTGKHIKCSDIRKQC